jgi:hypothetical protein
MNAGDRDLAVEPRAAEVLNRTAPSHVTHCGTRPAFCR